MNRHPQSTALRVAFKAFLSADHLTPATGKVIAITISQNGGAFANPSGGATNATEIGLGWYYVDLSTTDTGTLGPLLVHGAEATIDPADAHPIQIVNANTLGAAALPNVASGSAGSVPTTGNGANQITVSGGAVTIDGTSALTESYATLHAVPTVAQLLFEVRALLAQNSVAGTTVTTKKIDGVTTAHTYTLDSSTAPTSITTAS